MSYGVPRLAADLVKLGLAPGDTVLVRAAARAIGPTEGRPTDMLVQALTQLVGPSGTIVGLAFTDSVPSWRRRGGPVFRIDTPPSTGGFAAALVALPGAVRSRHPTNSFVGVGADAGSLLAQHDHTKTSFDPLRQLMQANAKMLLVGCVDSSPGFSTVHLVQEDLGLATRSLLSGVYGAWHEIEGERKWFARKDVSGCSAGFGKFFPRYEAAGVLRKACVGDALSALIGCREAYAIERDILARDPRFALCSRADCSSCRATRFYNLRDFPAFAFRSLISGRLWARLRR